MRSLPDSFQHLMVYDTPTSLKIEVGKVIMEGKETKTNGYGNTIIKIILGTERLLLSLCRLRLHFNDKKQEIILRLLYA